MTKTYGLKPKEEVPKTIVFHDDSDEAANAALYVNHCLPMSLQDKGIVRHYHGEMSKDYLTKVYDDFKKVDGVCRILHATEGASTACSSSYFCVFHLELILLHRD